MLYHKLLTGIQHFCVKPVFICAIAGLAACNKNIEAPPAAVVQSTAITAPQLNLSRSSVVLLEGNANNQAVEFDWPAFGNTANGEINYILEAGATGTQFADAVEIGHTARTKMSFTVMELNKQLRRLIIPGQQTRVEFRIKLLVSNKAPEYSRPIALDVTTFQPLRTVDNEYIIRIPGNFQNWKVPGAPQAVSVKQDGQYEGYVHFTDPRPEFLMVKGTDEWDFLRMYSDIGAGRFGFSGRFFMPREGAGIYRFYANTNTNAWTCIKINNWQLYGTAWTGDAVGADLKFDERCQVWTAVLSLKKGAFVFRANHTNNIVLGYDAEEGMGMLRNQGNTIEVPESGSYRVMLSVLSAGNYHYGIQRMP
jgi:hypothetical protein